MILYAIEKPTLLLDEERVRRNIQKMAEKAAQSDVRLRPHFKSHQSAGIGAWFREVGVTAVAVSSVDMATYFASHGWDDITIAFPVNLRQIDTINYLAGQVRLHLLVESTAVATALNEKLAQPVQVWIKIDVGYGRTGLAWDEIEPVIELAHTISNAPRLELAGLLTHAGHTYHADTPARIRAIYVETAQRMNAVRQQLQAAGMESAVSVGDTPGCSLVEQFGDVTEVRPDNFVFYDVMQAQLGACQTDEIGVAVACPIVAKHAAQRKVILYGGAVHLSKESVSVKGQPCYGRIALPMENGWGPALDAEKARLVSLSQEHGILQTDADTFNQLQVGDLVFVLPVHSCLTVDLYPAYLTLDGARIAKMRTH